LRSREVIATLKIRYYGGNGWNMLATWPSVSTSGGKYRNRVLNRNY
jgi:hypothetical protein